MFELIHPKMNSGLRCGKVVPNASRIRRTASENASFIGGEFEVSRGRLKSVFPFMQIDGIVTPNSGSLQGCLFDSVQRLLQKASIFSECKSHFCIAFSQGFSKISYLNTSVYIALIFAC